MDFRKTHTHAIPNEPFPRHHWLKYSLDWLAPFFWPRQAWKIISKPHPLICYMPLPKYCSERNFLDTECQGLLLWQLSCGDILATEGVGIKMDSDGRLEGNVVYIRRNCGVPRWPCSGNPINLVEAGSASKVSALAI